MPKLARQRTHVGMPSGANKTIKYNKNIMRKTTRRGAYKRRKKKAFQIRRAPFVETKRKSDEELRMAGFFAGTGSNSFLSDHTIFSVRDSRS